MPNKSFNPTDEQRQMVEAMCGYGIPVDEIAKVVVNPNTGASVCKQTMYNHFKGELETGMTKANAKVAEALYKQATTGNTTAAIWWSKARMGWRENRGLELSGGDKPITLQWADSPDDA